MIRPSGCRHSEKNPEDPHVYLVTPLDPQRGANFIRCFGTPYAEVTWRYPCQVVIQGELELAFWLDLDALSPSVLPDLFGHMMDRFGLSQEECIRELPHGVPIVADDLILAIYSSWDQEGVREHAN